MKGAEVGEDKINPVDFGRLIEAVEGMKKAMDQLNNSIQTLESRIGDLEKKKTLALGIILGVGGIGGSVGAAVSRFFGGGH